MATSPQLFWPAEGSNSINTNKGVELNLHEEWRQTLEDWRARGLPQRYFHMLGGAQWDYSKGLERLCHPPPTFDWKVLEEIYNDVSRSRQRDPAGYRDRVYCIEGKGAWSVREPRNK